MMFEDEFSLPNKLRIVKGYFFAAPNPVEKGFFLNPPENALGSLLRPVTPSLARFPSRPQKRLPKANLLRF